MFRSPTMESFSSTTSRMWPSGCIFRRRRANATLSPTSIESNSADPWKSIPNFRRAPTSSRSSIRRMSWPSIRISPASGRSSPTAHLMRTDLPVPLPPMTTVFFPFGTVRSRPSRTTFVPKRLLKPRIAITLATALSRQNMNDVMK